MTRDVSDDELGTSTNVYPASTSHSFGFTCVREEQDLENVCNDVIINFVFVSHSVGKRFTCRRTRSR